MKRDSKLYIFNRTIALMKQTREAKKAADYERAAAKHEAAHQFICLMKDIDLMEEAYKDPRFFREYHFFVHGYIYAVDRFTGHYVEFNSMEAWENWKDEQELKLKEAI